MGDFLTNISTIVNTILTAWIPSAIDLIVGQPLLLFTVGFLAVGGAIGILGRLLSKN